ncbi:hypothetical protein BFN67_12850 [Pseudaminobacter manganicus]|uniref:Uncharacterized protein n=1 Tax=Manganibacter manganicus TaxID=1873176 RepID=A0A1V8RUU1_9HYPH|nr:hypothetical protein BFN67_12850 [Pseudaminobacter manganicus]
MLIDPREEEGADLFAIAGEEVGSGEIPLAFLKRDETLEFTTPAGGGGPTGAVSVANLWEEVKAGLVRQGRGGGRR